MSPVEGRFTYEQVIRAAYYRDGAIVSVTCRVPKAEGVILIPGRSVAAVAGMIINAMITDNA